MRRLGLALLAVLFLAGPASATDYYATNNGSTTLDCLSIANACTIQRVLGLAAFGAGDTLFLLDGTYQGAANMLSPGTVNPGLSGTSGSPITVSALNDGAAIIDGEFARRPVYLSANNYWIIEGINAHSSSVEVLHFVGGSSNNIVRRAMIWDAPITKNSGVVVNEGGQSGANLLEDVAIFGTGSVTLTHATNTGALTVRRAWIRAEGSTTNAAQHEAVQAGYNLSSNFICENCIVTGSEMSLPATFFVTNSSGNPITASNSNCSDTQAVPPATQSGNFCTWALYRHRGPSLTTDNPATNSKLLGSLIYMPSGHRWRNASSSINPPLVLIPGGNVNISNFTLRDTVAYVDPSNTDFSITQGFTLIARDTSPTNLIAANITSVRSSSATTSFGGGVSTGDTFNSEWADDVGSSRSSGTSLGAVQSPWTATTVGANLCYRYVDGVRTTTPLWPWPMNERIKAATAAAGSYDGPCQTCTGGRSARTEVDVTAVVESLLGTIPSTCRSDPPIPEPPDFEDAPADWPSTAELDAFAGSGMGGWTTLSGNGWTEASGVATPTNGFSVVRFDTAYTANQEAWCITGGLPTEGGAGFHVMFLVQDASNRYRAYMQSVTGSNNDTIVLDKLVANSVTTLVPAVDLGVDLTAGDRLGVRVVDNVISVFYYASAWAEWRKVGTYTDSGLPSSSYIGLGASAGSCTSFGGGNVGGTGGGGSPPGPIGTIHAAPSLPAAPSIPAAPSRPANP